MYYLGLINIAKITGTPIANNFLCGDGSWKTPTSNITLPITLINNTTN